MPNRYAELAIDQIIAALRGASLRLLKRGAKSRGPLAANSVA
jgi:hypothetical protein